jgi:hypothetical protein
LATGFYGRIAYNQLLQAFSRQQGAISKKNTLSRASLGLGILFFGLFVLKADR